ncbi:MAG: HAD family hydrolase [Bacteriovoracaceae bacterium]|nr:HAD family hydrolase [Bacteriovoracaceae bacterium]
MIDPEKAKGHVVFDCDGTLISSFEGILNCLIIFLEAELERTVTREEIKDNYYAQLDVMAERFGIIAKCKEEKDRLLKSWADICAAQSQQNGLFPEVKELLMACEKEEWALYVWTGRDRVSALEILKALGIMPYFWDIRTASDGIPKPHPMGMEELVGEQDKKKVVLIGDSGADLRGAENFGCHFIGATWCDQADKKSLMQRNHTHSPLACLDKIKELFKD